MITHDTLLRVRETARIDEVAAGYLTLRRSGKGLVALCPFHDERHPSFRISPALNIGKCFSCGEAADPIRLVRHMEGCGFEEAVRLLARKYGIEVEEERGTEEAGRHEARQAILRGNEAFARSLLPYDPAEGITGEDENGEEDLRALRETFSHFGVGICPPDAPEGFRRFRRRLVFPVRTTGGQIAGFAGRYRGTEGAGTAKYVNSDNSEAYNKGRILYGLYEAVRAVRTEGDVLLCEGYKDVIAFHAAGIRHAAGLCGTALTEDHVRVIRRLTGHVTLALDPDPAGQAAPLRPSLAGTGMRGGPPSPARWHGPGRGVPPARGRGAAQARADRGGGLPEPPHPGGGGAERRARRRGDTGGARGDPSRRLSAGRVPADGGALQGYGYPPRRIA